MYLCGENWFCCSGSDENCMLSALTSCESKIDGISVDVAIWYRFVPLPQFLFLLQPLCCDRSRPISFKLGYQSAGSLSAVLELCGQLVSQSTMAENNFWQGCCFSARSVSSTPLLCSCMSISVDVQGGVGRRKRPQWIVFTSAVKFLWNHVFGKKYVLLSALHRIPSYCLISSRQCQCWGMGRSRHFVVVRTWLSQCAWFFCIFIVVSTTVSQLYCLFSHLQATNLFPELQFQL